MNQAINSLSENEIIEEKNELNKKIVYLKNKYAINILAIIWDYKKLFNGRYFILELWSLATESIKQAIYNTKENENNTNIELAEEFPEYLIDYDKKDDPDEVFWIYQIELQKLCDQYKNENKTLILWFSSLWAHSLMPRLAKIIKNLKEYNYNIIFVIWWADFNALPDREFIEKTFNYWIDIINIWWACEFVDFIWKIDDKNKFFRDENWTLSFTDKNLIPKNLIFYSKENFENVITPWKKIDTTYFYEYPEKKLHFAINNNPCINQCWYCSIVDEIEKWKTYNVDKTVNELNSYIKDIGTPINHLIIENPNPFQQINKFVNFLQNINLENIKTISFFSDFIWLWNNKIYDKVIKIIEELFSKYPDLEITTRFWIDALQKNEDWDFLWRTHWKNIVEEREYKAWLNNFDRFYNHFKYNKRLKFTFNLIFHPNMQVTDYINKINLFKKYHDLKPFWESTLIPELNTKISNDHKGYYMPKHELNNIKDTLKVNINNISLWGVGYLKSELLDLYVLFSNLWLEEGIFNFLWEYKNTEETENNVNYFKEFAFIQILQYFINSLIEYINSPINHKNEITENIKNQLEFCMNYLDVMIYRENYISSINPKYNTDIIKEFLNKLNSKRDIINDLSVKIVKIESIKNNY